MSDKLLRTEEWKRLKDNASRAVPLEIWGPYLSSRQWGTVREDYSSNGDAWNYLTHEMARSQAYRWGEDGIGGISDLNQFLCFAPAFWNGKDPILKERLYGLTNAEGNHGEDVKELYYMLDNTPTHSYMKFLYKYPQEEFPYNQLLETNSRLNKSQPEFEILDTGVFNNGRYFDIIIEYAKSGPEDVSIRITMKNHSPETAALTILPTLWYRNTWAPYPDAPRPAIEISGRPEGSTCVKASHHKAGDYYFYFSDGYTKLLFTENETNSEKLYGIPNDHPFKKDAFHPAITTGSTDLLSGKNSGTKFAPVYDMEVGAGAELILHFRLCLEEDLMDPFRDIDALFNKRILEANDFYKSLHEAGEKEDRIKIQRQAFAGLLWNKQYYHYDVEEWLIGDPAYTQPPAQRWQGRNAEWTFLNSRDIISMPDNWEYPWFAAWDLAFHCIPFSMIDPVFAKHQLILIMREWYMNPQGQIPAYEWNFSDVNPPVHAWAALNIYKIEKNLTGAGDISFLKRVFMKLSINFTWWVNRKDRNDNNLFEGGFLGLDNIGVINRNDCPKGYFMEQADGTSWMAMFALNMIEIAVEIAQYDPTFEDIVTKYYEHYVLIAESLNEATLWDEADGFFYDVLNGPDGRKTYLKVRSAVGLTVLFAVGNINQADVDALPDLSKRIAWYRAYRERRGKYLPYISANDQQGILITLIGKDKLVRILEKLLDEEEFLSPGGIRALSKYHESNPVYLEEGGKIFSVNYEPGESETDMFGGNSNWRGPVWMPMNYLLIKSLEKYHRFYGDSLKVEFPTGSGNYLNLNEVARELSNRVISNFEKDELGNRPIHTDHAAFYARPENKDLILFYEYLHGDNGRGLGATHQAGWTAVIAELINEERWEWD